MKPIKEEKILAILPKLCQNFLYYQVLYRNYSGASNKPAGFKFPVICCVIPVAYFISTAFLDHDDIVLR